MQLKIFQSNKKQAGQAALLTTIFVLTISLFIIVTISFLIVNEQKSSYNAVKSAQAYYAADAGVEDSLYRIIKGKNYLATNSLAVASSTAAINISDSSGQKIIRVAGENNDRFRNLQVVLNVTTDFVSFYYGVQVGEGGLTMDNNSQVKGSIYSNGSVSGANGAAITGDAFIASAPSGANQAHETKNADFIFSRQGDQIDTGQSFIPTISDHLIKVSLYLKKFGSPSNKTVRILTDNGNKPSKNLVSSGAYGTLIASQISQSSYDWVDVTMNTPPNLQAGVKYWIVIDTSADTNNYFSWGEDSSDSYADGTGKYSPNWNASSPSWYAINGDLDFKAWMGGTINSLSNLVIGGNAHANTISSCTIAGDAYFQTISNSTVSGTQYPNSPDPAMENMPISGSNIADWKSDAEAGGVINGNYTLDGSNNALGPKKINGNLTVSNNADLTITGTVYITGTISISNGAKVRLGANYGNLSGVVISDGAISVSNNAVFYTNGTGTYLMFLSIATGSAINISNNANTVIFYASRGTVNISNNAILREVTAYGVFLSNGAQIIYESGLASAKFSSGTGASWSIADWRETQ